MIAINITTSGTEITCIFIAGSHAIGCLITLKNTANGITHCIALQRFSNASANDLSIFQTCNTTFDAGRYLLQVYDIDTYGEISALPAITDEMQLGTSTTMILSPSASRETKIQH